MTEADEFFEKTKTNAAEPAVEYAVEYNDFNIDDIDFECDSLPKTVDELKAQIRISEEQIKRGECVTAQEAIKHFYSL